MIYYRKTLFGHGPKLTAVHINDRSGFSYLDQKDIDKCEEEKERRLEAKALKVNRKKDRPVRTPIGDFPSIFSAAKKIGIDRSTLSDRLKRKWEGYYFLVAN